MLTPLLAPNRQCVQAMARLVAFMAESDILGAEGGLHLWRVQPIALGTLGSHQYPLVEFDAAVNLAEYHHTRGNTAAALTWARRAINVWYEQISVGVEGTGMQVSPYVPSLGVDVVYNNSIKDTANMCAGLSWASNVHWCCQHALRVHSSAAQCDESCQCQMDAPFTRVVDLMDMLPFGIANTPCCRRSASAMPAARFSSNGVTCMSWRLRGMMRMSCWLSAMQRGCAGVHRDSLLCVRAMKRLVVAISLHLLKLIRRLAT